MLRTFPCLLAGYCLMVAVHAAVAEETPLRPRIDSRFADASAAEVPDFRQHVVPLMGKLGCNGRACHGSFQGQGGFRLSLFGYDFKADHENLLQGKPARINRQAPADSPMLRKPTLADDHDGGKKLDKGSWQYRALLNWIQAGAIPHGEKIAEFVRLDVTPKEIVATKKGETFTLKVIAVWSDGAREDVTPLCRFITNNDQIAAINEAGTVTSAGPGDTHVVVCYDNGVFPVPVIQPVSAQFGAKYPQVPAPTKVDELVIQKLRKLGVVPSPVANDADFLRRVSLDITGSLPAPQEVEAFLADTNPDKRAAKIDELLERPAYAAWWATKFSDYTGNNTKHLNNLQQRGTAAREWYEWLERRVAKNVPYDQIVADIVLANSRDKGESYADYCERMSKLYWKGTESSFADEKELTHYWVRSNFRKPEERALGFAYTFLGIRIQCAQCHKHPFDQWTKDDFERFTGFFGRITYGYSADARQQQKQMLEALDVKVQQGNDIRRALDEKLRENKVVPFQELFVTPPNKVAKAEKAPDKDKAKRPTFTGRTAKLLGAEEVSLEDVSDPREALMEWLRDRDNPYFAKAIVNRVWAAYFNVGIVEPPDDLSLANPPSNAALLEYLADEFVEHGYDLKWLHRTIANSRTYQLDWHTNESNKFDDRNFSHSIPRRIPAEVVLDAVRQATASDYELAKSAQSTKGRSIEDGQQSRNNNNTYALTVFGRSVRESNCECDRSAEPSLLQTVFLQNDSELLTQINRNGGWVDQVVKQGAGVKTTEKTTTEKTNPAKPNSEKSRAELRAEAITESRKNNERTLDRARERLVKAKAANDADMVAKLEARIKEVEEAMKPTKTEPAKTETDKSETTETASKATSAVVAVPTIEAAQIIRSAYLRTVSRPPSEAELTRALAYFRENDLRTASRDLLWALLNTKEFVVNH